MKTKKAKPVKAWALVNGKYLVPGFINFNKKTIELYIRTQEFPSDLLRIARVEIREV